MIKQQYSDTNLPYKVEYNLLQQHEKHATADILSLYKAAYTYKLVGVWNNIFWKDKLPVSKNAFKKKEDISSKSISAL